MHQRSRQNGPPVDYAAVAVQQGDFAAEVWGQRAVGVAELQAEKAVVRMEVVVAEPPQLAVEKVEVVLPHAEAFAELLAEQQVLLRKAFLKALLKVFLGQRVLQTVDLAVVFYVDLQEDVAVGLGRHVVSQS